MKGPYERLKYTMHRLWECPACGHHERTGGDVINMFCRCQVPLPRNDQIPMKLIEDGIRRTNRQAVPMQASEAS